MKTLIKHYPLFSKRMIMASVFVGLVISCSKNSDNTPNTKLNFCTTVDWKNTIGLSGYFKGALVSGTWGLTSENLTENGITKTVIFNRDATGHFTNGYGLTFTYDQNKLVKIETEGENGPITYTFDVNSHLTETHVHNTDNSGTSDLILTYTYDTNGDPVKISGHGLITSGDFTTDAYYTITADYLTDKTNFLPLLPEITPFTVNFAYSWFLSQHLINKWQIRISSISSDGTFNDSNITQQYTYTYDSDGKVATMSHSGSNTFTFTYSGCN
jgi:hypothetical protein